MTEYTGWDNYVKEHYYWLPKSNPTKQYYIDSKAFTDLQEKVKDLEQFTNLKVALREETTDLRNQVKDLEEWHKQEDINKSTDISLAKVWMQDLTQLKERVKDLEGAFKEFDPVNEIEKRLLGRIEDLEEWKANHHMQSVGHIEAWWLDDLKKKVKYLEDWKEYHSGIDNKAFDALNIKVKALEEWKAKSVRDWVRDSYENNKLIDKKVWEDIKREVENIRFVCYGSDYIYYNNLRDAIKKAEGDKD
jgi:hypothetical protein